MLYKATIFIGNDKKTETFDSISDAANWLDSENNNLEYMSTIECVSKETGLKQGGFVYTEGSR